jgi:GDP-L-fucose synthase
VFDTSKPDGTPRKLADTTKLKTLGWNKARTIEAGVREVYATALADNIFGSTI